MAKNLTFYLADQNPHRDRSLGITNITKTLMGGLAQLPNYSLSQVVSESSFAFEDDRIKKHTLPWRTDNSKVNRLLTDNLHPLFLKKIPADIWLYPKGYLPFLSKPDGVVVGLMHDALLLHYADKYPHFRSRLDLAYWLNILKTSLRKCDYVLTVSESAKKQLTDVCERYNIAQPKIFVTYEASDFESLEPSNFTDKGNYVIHLASEQPHKCTLPLLKFWKQLSETDKNLPDLHLIGKICPESEKLVTAIPGVVRKSHLPEEVFVDEIRKARALLFPSESEGFGLPAIESYFLNTPVVYVEGTSVAEIMEKDTKAGEFSLSSFESFKKALNDVLNLTPEEIAESRAKLLDRFSKRRYLANVDQALASIN
ncbi:glycosyltransferase [Pontibacter burrus]|uniref:Glycosyltransferase family 4 protein n=1 Tax=Pontibacter burrus TaxID=2704466 RepID=A0A6B3LQV1_9BACT|nr:glycosyltransferase [Pontibacter burrus]NEM99189.1 glycosyltransferase family 4 protein [Pontibacter burrus]